MQVVGQPRGGEEKMEGGGDGERKKKWEGGGGQLEKLWIKVRYQARSNFIHEAG